MAEPRVRVVATTLSLSFELREARSVPSSGELVIAGVRPDDVDVAVLIDIGNVAVRFETSTRLPCPDLLTVLHVGETGRLFLGGGERSCVVDLASKTVEHSFEHCLFWGFELGPRPDLILETGELDCLFRWRDGRIASLVAVEPPWESTVEADGIHFAIAGVGTRVLPFPS